MVEWKIKGLFKANAQDVYDEITSIGKEVTPEQIVEKASDASTALHSCFEWDDKKAAHKFRIGQAQMIVRNIVEKVEYEDSDGRERQFVVRAIVSGNKYDNKYETIRHCIENPESFARLQASMLRDLEVFKQRYERYASLKEEFSELFNAINTIV